MNPRPEPPGSFPIPAGASRGDPPWDATQPAVALVDARLVEGTGQPPVDGAVVVLDHGRLVAVGPRARVPRGAAVLDLQGATVTPGVVDAHVHLALAGHPSLVVRGGVTAVRDMGWPPDQLRFVVRAAWSSGLLVHAVGPILTAPEGYPTRAAWAPSGTGRVLSGVDDAVRAVDEVVALGASAVKVALDDRRGPLLPQRTLTAVVERSQEWGRIVTGHVGTADALGQALDAGVGELAHVPFSATAVPDDLVARAVGAGVRLVPTMHCRDGDPPEEREAALGFLRRWVALGGEVAYGTDLGNAGTSPGVDRRELALLSEAGMAPGEIVVAATSRAADAIGAWDLTGRIAPGLRADLLVLDDDPLADAAALARPRWVVAAGLPVAW